MHSAVRQAVILKRWSPRALGPSLLGWWDAEDLSALDLSGANVTTWRDKVAAYAATQATSAFKPVWGASSFNGRPGVTFDGTDDTLDISPVPAAFPVGASPCEMWALCSNAAAGASAGERDAVGYGTGGSRTRRIGRQSVGSVNRGIIVTGNASATLTAIDATIDLTGPHVLRGVFGATSSSISVDGGAQASMAVVPATVGAKFSIGSSSLGSSFWQGSHSAILITAALTDTQAAQLTAYLKSRGGIA